MLGCKSRAGRRMGGRRAGAALLAGVVMGAVAAPAAAQMVHFSSGQYQPVKLSRDGRTIGLQTAGDLRGYRVASYRIGGGLIYLRASDRDYQTVAGVSGDGSSLLVWNQEYGAMRWSPATEEVVHPAEPSRYTQAFDLSSDGHHALIGRDGLLVRWSVDVEMPIAAGWDGRISDDGRTIVFNGVEGPMRWREGLGLDSLPVPAGDEATIPLALSSDGRVVYGTSHAAATPEYTVVRWTATAGGPMALSVIAGPYSDDGPRFADVAGTTADGSMVALNLWATNEWQQQPFIWSEARGLRTVVAYMAERGVEAGDVQPRTVCGISRDGRRLAGALWFPGVWHATLPPARDDANDGTIIGGRTRRP